MSIKRKLYGTLLIVFFLLVADLLFHRAYLIWDENIILRAADLTISSLLLFLLIQNFMFGLAYSKHSKGYVTATVLVLSMVLSIHLADRLLAIDRYYHHFLNLSKYSSGNLWHADPHLSYRPYPDSLGHYTYELGDSVKGNIEVRFNGDGFRTVPDSLMIVSDTFDLYLGCSYTFGDYIRAQDGYPYLVSKALGHGLVNAGGSGYGLAQMKLLLDSLLETRPFHYVFLQLSPWLADRAMHYRSQAHSGYHPSPYFSDEGNKPVLQKQAYGAPKHYYDKKILEVRSSYIGKWEFVWNYGAPVEITDYYRYHFTILKGWLGMIPRPTKRKYALERSFYDHAIKTCKLHKAIPVIIKARYPYTECEELLRSVADRSIVIDLDHDLETRMNETGGSYYELFGVYHQRESDSVLVDIHPSAYTNRIFTHRILRRLQSVNKSELSE